MVNAHQMSLVAHVYGVIAPIILQTRLIFVIISKSLLTYDFFIYETLWIVYRTIDISNSDIAFVDASYATKPFKKNQGERWAMGMISLAWQFSPMTLCMTSP